MIHECTGTETALGTCFRRFWLHSEYKLLMTFREASSELLWFQDPFFLFVSYRSMCVYVDFAGSANSCDSRREILERVYPEEQWWAMRSGQDDRTTTSLKEEGGSTGAEQEYASVSHLPSPLFFA